MIDEKDIKVGLRFHASMDGQWFMDGRGDKKAVFIVKGFDYHHGEVYIETNTCNRFLLKAFLGKSRRYEIEYADSKYQEGEIALRYMNEQRGKAIASEGIRQFERITGKMLNTYKAKNHDYGNAFSEMYDELGINYGYGKIREKVNRIKILKDCDAQVANEPLEDALLDCANYCILTLMEYQKRKEDDKD